MTPVCPCTLNPTVAHEAWGPLTLAGIAGYRVTTWRNGKELTIRVWDKTRLIGEAIARQYADDLDLTKDIWGAEIVLNGYTWSVSGRVGEGVLEFASPSRPRTLADVEAGEVSLHEQCVGATDEWYTPKYVFDAMDAVFDNDVASPGFGITPWIPAKAFYTNRSLENLWGGFIWMNPPFGGRNGLVPWLEKFIDNGNGVALVPDRTSAPWWQASAPKMNALLFVSPKIKFIGADGKPGRSPAQGTTLMAIGARGASALRAAERRGLGVYVTP